MSTAIDKPSPSAPAGMAIDLGPIAASVERTLRGDVASAEIEQVLRALLHTPELASARVTTFVPIFLHRSACERLRSARPG